MESPPYVPVARVVTTHGIKGELSVAPTTAYDLSQLVDHDVWIAPPVRLARSHRVLGIRSGPKGPLILLEGVDDVEHAREAVGAALLVPPGALAPESLENEWDPAGYIVLDAERGDLGQVRETIVTGANDVWVVDGPLGEVLIPVIEDVVLEVDDETATIRVRLLPGLIGEEA